MNQTEIEMQIYADTRRYIRGYKIQDTDRDKLFINVAMYVSPVLRPLLKTLHFKAAN